MKLPGLLKYLSQNLGHPVAEVQKYRGLVGAGVVDAPAFKANMLSFAVCYGLVLQGLGIAKLSTNLLPPEIVTDRLIRDKKPWAVAMVAVLLLGISINFFGHWRAWNSVHPKKFEREMGVADRTTMTASSERQSYDEAKAQFDQINQVGEGLVGNVDGRLLWLEMLTALNQCLPADPKDQRPDDVSKRNEIHITSLQCEWFPELAQWYNGGIADKIKAAYVPPPASPAAATPPGAAAEAPPNGGAAEAPADRAAGAEAIPAADAAAPQEPAMPETPDPGPQGKGWVIQLRGYHYHNEDLNVHTAEFVRQTLIENLRHKKVTLVDKDGNPSELDIKDLGIGYPVITSEIGKFVPETINDPNDPDKPLTLKRWNFTLQFSWQPTPLSKRIELKKQREQGQPAGALAQAPGGGP
jgi:hypothetical protein